MAGEPLACGPCVTVATEQMGQAERDLTEHRWDLASSDGWPIAAVTWDSIVEPEDRRAWGDLLAAAPAMLAALSADRSAHEHAAACEACAAGDCVTGLYLSIRAQRLRDEALGVLELWQAPRFWIPCTEALPPDDCLAVWVWAVFGDDPPHAIPMTGEWDQGAQTWYDSEGDSITVTHWRPIVNPDDEAYRPNQSPHVARTAALAAFEATL